MENIAIIYWSGTGNTKIMAEEIAKGITDGGANVELYDVTNFNGDISKYNKLAFGCPSMGDEVLEECDFEPFFTSIENFLNGKKITLFGSYGWGDGQWMRNWKKRVEDKNSNLFNDGLIICGEPDDSGKLQCFEFGSEFAKY